MSNLLYQLSAFLKTEPKYLEREKGNIFASALSQTYRYLEFTDTIRARVEKASAKFITSLNEFQEMLNKGNNQTGKSGRYLTKKEEAQFRRKNRNSQIFQLEIESFYIFAKIYLDKTAHALETYFGERRNCSFESFSKFASKFKTLESVDKFTVELELQEIALKLKQEIVDFRDKKIAHAKMPRVHHGLTWSKEGRVSINAGFLYPKPTDKSFQTKDVQDLWELIEQYTNLWTRFITLNRPKAKFLLKVNQKQT